MNGWCSAPDPAGGAYDAPLGWGEDKLLPLSRPDIQVAPYYRWFVYNETNACVQMCSKII